MNEELREELTSAIVDGMIREMTFEDLRQFVWDSFYDDLLGVSDWELCEYGERYAPECEGAG